MPPTADNSIVGLRTQVSLTSQSSQLIHGTMKDIAAMSGDASQHNGFPSSENCSHERKSSKYDFFYKEPCLYSQRIYSNAAKVFSSLKHESREELENPYKRRQQELNGVQKSSKTAITDLEFDDDNEKRLTFELAFETLKYQRVFEDLLQECSFFTHFPECQEDESLVFVVVWDYQSRKFQQRTPFKEEQLNPIVQSVEEAIIEYKTKLNASLARHRIKAMAPSIEYLLPDKVRSKEEIRSKLPVYVWVNQLKTTMETVISQFKDDHYTLINDDDNFDGKVLYVDHHCSDMIVLPADSREYILDHDLLQSGHIVMQDKSSCIAPQSVKYLIGDDDDVIHVNVGSGVTTAHIASLMNNSSGHILAFGAIEGSAVQHTMERFGAKNIKIQTESFLDIDTDDNKYKNVKVVLVTADCSKSGIANPIDFVVNEGEDMKILKYLSLGETDDTKLGEMIANHGKVLRQAMKLSKVQAVVYMTRSVNESENENVVTKAVEQTNMIQQRKFPYRVVPPVLPFTGSDIEKGIGICGKFIKFQPSEKNSGCFVAVITREPEDIKEANKDILERARAKGLLGGKKKQKKAVEPEVIANGDAEEGDDEKLLERRVKRSPRKLRPTQSYPADFNYSKPSAVSIVKAQINSANPIQGHRATKSSAAIGARPRVPRLRPLAEPIEKKDKPLKVSEHVKVVKHPAPFSISVKEA
ncbi:putative methyltransferase NSUN7 isoform X2 [Ruditapes philippinarum]|uniref:putative methyltransferase NSUN7 isoform X2 n=1 Tax=Ruditapes philippinarum TaxID=129788 RepID=UPI00295BD035|nr:putative methyltransferase NSUN7 isoform X2 [Ruditapes philippinarum]